MVEIPYFVLLHLIASVQINEQDRVDFLIFGGVHSTLSNTKSSLPKTALVPGS